MRMVDRAERYGEGRLDGVGPKGDRPCSTCCRFIGFCTLFLLLPVACSSLTPAPGLCNN